MTFVTRLDAHIGEVKIGRPGQSLHALLGSCIGIGFLYPEKQIYGLAHCLLSRSPSPISEIGARHVDQAVQSLIHLMELDDKDLRKVEVILAGGGNMTMPSGSPPSKMVGTINADFARMTIRSKRLNLVDDDLGGMNARKVEIDCTTGDYSIKVIPRLGDGS